MTQREIRQMKHEAEMAIKNENEYKENLPMWLRIQIRLYEKWKTRKLKQISWSEL